MEPEWYKALDQLRETADRHALPGFKTIVKRRSSTLYGRLPSESELLRALVEAIAYSQGARSSMVGPLIRSPTFSRVFLDFHPRNLAKARADKIIHDHWDVLKVMRFRGKVDAIIRCAKKP